MIYLTGQLLVFLLVTAFTGFIIGWLLRGAMLPVSMLNSGDILYQTESHSDHAPVLVNPSKPYNPEKNQSPSE